MLLVFAILLIIILVVLVRCIVIVPQSNAYVTEWLGVYKDTWGAGLHIRTPFVERISRKVSLKEEAADFPPQPVITRDNVTMMIDTVVFFQVFDAKMYAYGVNRPIQAIENLSATTLRDIIGSMTLDETLTSRDLINTKITASLDEATDRWGIKVNRVELKNIEPPVEIRQAMEKQMKADREKRASILLAEGEKQAAITRAEGEKESAILRAEAVKQQRIREAEGEAEALLTVQKAQADAIRMINEANPNHNYLALRSMEAMEKVADGKATKLIVPSDMQNLAATVSAIKEISGEVTEENLTFCFPCPRCSAAGSFCGDERWRQGAKAPPTSLRSSPPHCVRRLSRGQSPRKKAPRFAGSWPSLRGLRGFFPPTLRLSRIFFLRFPQNQVIL